MAYYCKTKDCLRAYILRYFGEKTENFCGNCGNCNTHYEEADITEDAQKILSHIVRMKERYGIKMIVDTLRGSKAERILKLQLDKIKTYGIMHGVTEKRIRDVINYLLLHGYLMQTDTEYPLLKLKAKAGPVLRGQERIAMKLVKKETPCNENPYRGNTGRVIAKAQGFTLGAGKGTGRPSVCNLYGCHIDGYVQKNAGK
mgnify:CR=1 FL=1